MKMSKIIRTHIKRHHIVKVKEIREAFNIPKGEMILNFGLWSGRSPYDVERGVNPDTHDEWFIETDETTGKQNE